ncbi:MAG TPA: hypothetical protein VFV38_12715 [Ktedonobacteraceae bacterium]|nr:hypothetical protein [Ktedonobacteraceae bacterium]
MDNTEKPYSAWGSLGILMRKDKRFVIVVYLSIGSIMLFASLFLSTGLEIFRWLAYFSLAVLIAIGLGGEAMNTRNRFQHRNREKPNH